MLDGLLLARNADRVRVQRPDGPGIVAEERRARLLDVSRSACLWRRTQQLLPIAGWEGGLAAVPRQCGARTRLRQSTRAAGAAVHVEARRHAGFRAAGRN